MSQTRVPTAETKTGSRIQDRQAQAVPDLGLFARFSSPSETRIAGADIQVTPLVEKELQEELRDALRKMRLARGEKNDRKGISPRELAQLAVDGSLPLAFLQRDQTGGMERTEQREFAPGEMSTQAWWEQITTALAQDWHGQLIAQWLTTQIAEGKLTIQRGEGDEGSYFNPHTERPRTFVDRVLSHQPAPEIVIDRALTLQEALEAVVHEALHASSFLESRTVRPTLIVRPGESHDQAYERSRADFVQGKLNEEALAELLRVLVIHHSLWNLDTPAIDDDNTRLASRVFMKAVAGGQTELQAYQTVLQELSRVIGITPIAAKVQQLAGLQQPEPATSEASALASKTTEKKAEITYRRFSELHFDYVQYSSNTIHERKRPERQWVSPLSDQLDNRAEIAKEIYRTALLAALPQTFIDTIIQPILEPFKRISPNIANNEEQRKNWLQRALTADERKTLERLEQMIETYKEIRMTRMTAQMQKELTSYLHSLTPRFLEHILDRDNRRLTLQEAGQIQQQWRFLLMLHVYHIPFTYIPYFADQMPLALQKVFYANELTSIDTSTNEGKARLKYLSDLSKTWFNIASDASIDTACKEYILKIKDLKLLEKLLHSDMSIADIERLNIFPANKVADWVIQIQPHLSGTYDVQQAAQVRNMLWIINETYADAAKKGLSLAVNFEYLLRRIKQLEPELLRMVLRGELTADDPTFSHKLTGIDAFWLEFIKLEAEKEDPAHPGVKLPGDRVILQQRMHQLMTQYPEVWFNLWEEYVINRPLPTVLIDLLLGNIEPHDYILLMPWVQRKNQASTPKGADQVNRRALDDIHKLMLVTAPELTAQDRTDAAGIGMLNGILDNAIIDGHATDCFSLLQQAFLHGMIDENSPELKRLSRSERAVFRMNKENWQKRRAILRSLNSLDEKTLGKLKSRNRRAREITSISDLPRETLWRLIDLKKHNKPLAEAIFSGTVTLGTLVHSLHPQDLNVILQLYTPTPAPETIGGRPYSHVGNILNVIHQYDKGLDIGRHAFLGESYFGIPVYLTNEMNTLVLGGTGAGKSAFILGALLLAMNNRNISFIVRGDKDGELRKAAAGHFQNTLGMDVFDISFREDVPDLGAPAGGDTFTRINPIAWIPVADGLSEKDRQELIESLPNVKLNPKKLAEFKRLGLDILTALQWDRTEGMARAMLQNIIHEELHKHNLSTLDGADNLKSILMAAMMYLREKNPNEPAALSELIPLLESPEAFFKAMLDKTANKSKNAKMIAESLDHIDKQLMTRLFSALNPFVIALKNPTIARITSGNDIDPVAILTNPTLIFFDSQYMNMAELRWIVDALDVTLHRTLADEAALNQFRSKSKSIPEHLRKRNYNSVVEFDEEYGAWSAGGAGSQAEASYGEGRFLAWARSPLNAHAIVSTQNPDQISERVYLQMSNLLATGLVPGATGKVIQSIGQRVREVSGRTKVTAHAASKSTGTVAGPALAGQGRIEYNREETDEDRETVSQEVEDVFDPFGLSQIRDGLVLFYTYGMPPLVIKARYSFTDNDPEQSVLRAVYNQPFHQEDQPTQLYSRYTRPGTLTKTDVDQEENERRRKRREDKYLQVAA